MRLAQPAQRSRRPSSSTGWRSVGELLMTRRISLVAVCCSSASVSSRLRASSSWNSRAFSMAITAWSAKVWSSAICLSEKGLTSLRVTVMAPIGLPSRSIGTDRVVWKPACTMTAVDELGISGNVWHVGDGACQYGAGRDATPAWRYWEDAPDGLKFVGRPVMVGHQVDQACRRTERRRRSAPHTA